MTDRTARSRIAIAVASLLGIAGGIAIGLTGYDGDVRWTWGAAAALVLALGAFALGTRMGPSSTAASPPSDDGSAGAVALRRERDAARDELATLHSALSHGLRSPIGAVINFAAVLDGDCGHVLGVEGRALLGRIDRSARSALSVVEGVARLSAVSRRDLALQSIDAETLLRATFAAVAPADRSLELTVIEPLPVVVADADLLRVAFEELLANAVRFTAGREKARVTVGGHRDAGAVVYWIEDNGIGFDARSADRIFRPFERLHRDEGLSGAGVGLAIVRRVAQRHGGSAGGEGTPARGARFHLTLPDATGRAS